MVAGALVVELLAAFLTLVMFRVLIYPSLNLKKVPACIKVSAINIKFTIFP
jgi:hypothetical protein